MNSEINSLWHGRRRVVARGGPVFAVQCPTTDPNTGTSTSEHATRGTPKHYAIKVDLKRICQIGLVLIGERHTDEVIKIMTTALDHDGLPTGCSVPVTAGSFPINGVTDQTPYYLIELL